MDEKHMMKQDVVVAAVAQNRAGGGASCSWTKQCCDDEKEEAVVERQEGSVTMVASGVGGLQAAAGSGGEIVGQLCSQGLEDLGIVQKEHQAVFHFSESMKIPQDVRERISAEFNKTIGLIPECEYFLVSSSWFGKLKDWIIATEEGIEITPGPIQNEDLLDPLSGEQKKLKANLFERSHYVIMNQARWDLVMKWFGGGPEIKRRTFRIGQEVVLDVYGINLKIKSSIDPKVEIQGNFPKYATVGSVIQWICPQLGVEDEKTVRLWDYYGERYFHLLQPLPTLQQANLLNNQSVMVEHADPVTGEFEVTLEPKKKANSESSDLLQSESTSSSKQRLNPRGLADLGDTSFMNSALQCLSFTPPLRNYFLSGEYKNDINAENPLGMKGKLAKSFGSLLQDLWELNRGEIVSVVPQRLKSTINQCHPELFMQNRQDPQRFLMILLDILHEDLNRVKEKPYTKAVESNGRPDHEVARESLEIFKRRNDSEVGNIFMGQLRNTAVCPKKRCGYVSVTFDPYMCVQLPLSKEKAKMQSVMVGLVNPDTWKLGETILNVQVPMVGPCFLIRAKVAEMTGIPIEALMIGRVQKGNLSEVIGDIQCLDELSPDGKLYFAYQDPNASLALLCYLRRDEHETIWFRHLRPLPGEENQVASLAAQEDQTGDSKMEIDAPKIEASAPKHIYSEGSQNISTQRHWQVGDVWFGTYLVGPNRRDMRMEIISVVESNNIEDGVEVTCVFDFSINTSKSSMQGAFYAKGKYFPSFSKSGEAKMVVDEDEEEEEEEIEFTYSGWEGSYGREELNKGGLHFKGNVHNSGLFFIGQVLDNGCGYLYMTRYQRARDIARLDTTTDIASFVSVEIQQAKIDEIGNNSSKVVPYLITMPIQTTQAEFIREINYHLDLMVSDGQLDGASVTGIGNCFTVLRSSHKPSSSSSSSAGGELILDPNSNEPAFTGMPHENMLMRWNWSALSKIHIRSASTSEELECNGDPFTLGEILFGERTSSGLAKEKEAEAQVHIPVLTLDDCLDFLSQEKQLSEADAWYCPNCKSHKKAFKKTELWTVPPILILHLDRFHQEAEKNEEMIRFPLDGLDLTKRVKSGEKEVIYDLLAVTNHIEDNDFTTYARDITSEDSRHTWYELDNSNVTTITPMHVPSVDAYILFYIRRYEAQPKVGESF